MECGGHRGPSGVPFHFPVETSKDPIGDWARRTLDAAIYWIIGCVLFAVYEGITVRPPMSYTVGSALLGVPYAIIIMIQWRTRRSGWSIVGVLLYVLGTTTLRDAFFPGTGFLRGMYGHIVSIGTAMLLLYSFRGFVSHLCHLDRDPPTSDPAEQLRDDVGAGKPAEPPPAGAPGSADR